MQKHGLWQLQTLSGLAHLAQDKRNLSRFAEIGCSLVHMDQNKATCSRHQTIHRQLSSWGSSLSQLQLTLSSPSSPADHGRTIRSHFEKGKLWHLWGFPGGSRVKNPPVNARDAGLSPGSGRYSGGGNGNPVQDSRLESHGQRSLAGYSPWGRKESDMTEHACSDTNIHPRNLTSRYLPSRNESIMHTKTCTRMLMIVKTQAQPRRPSASSSTVDIHMMKCYLPVKKNELLIYVSRMNLINIMLDIVINERSQMQKTSYCTILSPFQYSCLENSMDGGSWKDAVHGVAEGRTWLSDFTFTFHFLALEKEMATRSSVLAWRIPGTGETGGLPSMGSHRVGHDWSDLADLYETSRKGTRVVQKVGNRSVAARATG